MYTLINMYTQAGAAAKEIEALKKSLAEASDKAAALSKEKVAAEERAEAAQQKAKKKKFAPQWLCILKMHQDAYF